MITYTFEPRKFYVKFFVRQDWLSPDQPGCTVAVVELCRLAQLQPQKSVQNEEHGGDARRPAIT